MRICSTVLLCSLLLSTGCASHMQRSSHAAPMDRITHVVVCWLNTPGDVEQAKQLIERSKTFEDIPGVISIRVGKRLQLPTTRPIDETTFGIALVVTFKSADDLRAYQASPQHEAAVREVLKPLTSKITVYDFTAE